MKNKIYSDSGVDIEEGYKTIDKIKTLSKKTQNKGALSSIGGFAGLFDLTKYKYKNPILVSSTDGVGTKLLINIETNKGYDTIGQDLVAMCANDIVAQGAEPLFFLDYFATSNLDSDIVYKIVKGITKSLESINTVLIGGETAEMPGMYKKGHYDIAGFIVGVIEKNKIINGIENVKCGDVLIGLKSNGVHSNGFSLIRKIIKDNNIDINSSLFEGESTILSHLLKPTKLYVNCILNLLKEINVHGISHITGGGFYENIPRMIDKKLDFQIDFNKIRVPKIFKWIQQLSLATDKEMYSTFNMGVGMVIAVSQNDVNKTIRILKSNNQESYRIGTVIKKCQKT